MTYLDELAIEIERQIPSDLLPDGDTRPLFRLYALLALAVAAIRSVAGQLDRTPA